MNLLKCEDPGVELLQFEHLQGSSNTSLPLSNPAGSSSVRPDSRYPISHLHKAHKGVRTPTSTSAKRHIQQPVLQRNHTHPQTRQQPGFSNPVPRTKPKLNLSFPRLAAPDLPFIFYPSATFSLSTTASTYPFDPAFSLLFWEPWNSARQIPEQALLDAWRSQSAFCLHQASYNISDPSRAFHDNAGNFTLDGHMDRLGSHRGRNDVLKCAEKCAEVMTEEPLAPLL